MIISRETLADRQIAVSRLVMAPRSRVFDAWTDPVLVAAWWGPEGFQNTIDKMEVAPGGKWEFVMHGPDGRDYKNKMVYVEIEKPDRLVLDHISGPVFRMEVGFSEHGGEDPAGHTEVAVQMIFASQALRDQVAREAGAEEGLRQTLDRLARTVEKG